MRILPRLLVLAVLSVAPAVQAGGWYVGGYFGANEADGTEFLISSGSVGTSYDVGTVWGFAVGYDFGKVRVEGEILTSRTNDVDSHELDGAGLAGSTGEVKTEAGIANVILDFRRRSRVSPFVGLGLGFAEVELNGFGVTAAPELLGDEDNTVVFQLIAGVGFELHRRLVLDVDLRYYEPEDPEIRTSPATGALSNEVTYDAFSLTAGLRYEF